MINHFTDIEIEIIAFLRKNDYSTLSEISKNIERSMPSVHYNLKKLLDRQLIFQDEIDKKKYYLQPFLAQEDVYNAMTEAITIVLDEYSDLIQLNGDSQETVQENDIKGSLFADAIVLGAIMTISDLIGENN